MGGAPTVQAPKAPDTYQEYSGAIQAYTNNAGQLYQEEAQYQPQYNALQQQMNQANIEQYQNMFNQMAPAAQQLAGQLQTQAEGQALGQLRQYGAAATQATYASNPMYGQLANFAQGQMNAGLDPTLTGLASQVAKAVPGQMQAFQNIGQQAQADVQPINQQLQDLYGKVGSDTTAADLTQLRNQVASNQRSDIFNQTAANIMGSLGQVDPLTQQLKNTAQQQLAAGSNLTPAQAADAAQQARAAFSSRGMLMSNPSMAAEVLQRFNVGQQLLQQREQFAGGVSQIADQQQQERVANAFGLSQADIAATQANQQMAGQMTQAIAGINQANTQLGAGIQGQIMGNLQNARQMQMAAEQQALGAYQTGIQEQGTLQQSALANQQQSQAMGAGLYQYLTGVGQQGMANILGQQAQGGNYATMGYNMNQYGTGGPALFQSSGVLQLAAQNAMANMNAQGAANQMNAQSRGASSGAMIGAGAGIASALIVGGVAL